jgi:HD-GYP domain-containing protein (c-di-GMP phosphodiesterase class II)
MSPMSGGSLVPAFQRLLDRARVRSVTASASVTAAVVGLLAAGWLIVHATNGTSAPFTAVMYLPILIASVAVGVRAGAMTAIVAAALLGPFMPRDVALGLEQPLVHPLVRGLFFLVAAVAVGTLVDATRSLNAQLSQAKDAWGEQSFENVRLFARLVAGRDEQTGRHCERVGQNALTLARAAGVTGSELHHVYLAGVLHDLGKLDVPGDILRKPSALTREEADVVMRHAASGEEIVLRIFPSAVDIARGTRSHHERWDGTGYPDGLAGEEIPAVGRILAIVDVFEAVTGTRTYRGPMAVSDARRLIEEGAGTHFDPKLVDLFLDLEAAGAIQREAGPEPVEGRTDDGAPAAAARPPHHVTRGVPPVPVSRSPSDSASAMLRHDAEDG